MSLFQEEAENLLLAHNFKDSWVRALAPHLNDAALQNTLLTVQNARAKTIVYPAEEDVFKLFKTIDFDNVKVVVIGQDPYPNENAIGISFGCGVQVSPSLNQIFAVMIAQGYCKEPVNNRKTLEYLVNQGVFLYNTILTVEANKTMSHSNIGWNHFTDAVIKALNTKKDLAWLLWGNSAKEFAPRINSKHLILQAEHPAFAARSNKSWNCLHFTVVNEYLRTRGLTEIKW